MIQNKLRIQAAILILQYGMINLSNPKVSEISVFSQEAIALYNRTPHELLGNVPPNDVYSERKEVIVQRRRVKDQFTMGWSRQYNLYGGSVDPTDDPEQH